MLRGSCRCSIPFFERFPFQKVGALLPRHPSHAFFLAILFAGSTQFPIFAAENNFSALKGFSGPYVITIKGVYLRNKAGEWVKIIEPDRKVDLSREEAVITFFNNAGRVPAGSYKNFRVEFFGEDLKEIHQLYAKNDFEQGILVKKGSFIHVDFDLRLEGKILVEKAKISVDEETRELLSDSLILEV